MNTSTPPTSPGERTQIDVRAIERELSRLWEQLDEQENTAQGHAVARTCVHNFVVVTSGWQATERATETIARLAARHPSRTILISATPGSQKDMLDAWAQMHCYLPGPGRPKVCGEQITIEARGAAVDRVPGTILPLLVPDVPVMLWWPRGEPFDDPRFAKFADLVDRVIVDSATFGAPEAGLAHMAARLGAETRISDLAWSRLTRWRELIAQFFDTSATVGHLAEITRVRVEYEARAGSVSARGKPSAKRSQALLIVAWLAGRLGWQISAPLSDDAGGRELRLARADGAEVTVELREVEPKDDVLDRLAALVIECERARFTIVRDDEPDCAVTRAEVAGRPPLQRKVRLQRLDEADLIAEELRLLGRDRTFEETLRVAAALVGSRQ